MIGNMKIEARRSAGYFGKRVELHGYRIKDDGRVEHVTNCIIESHPPDECCMASPFAGLDETGAQFLMDSLWDCGIRPSEGQGSAGQLAAVKEHLDDMRAIVFKELKGIALKVEATGA